MSVHSARPCGLCFHYHPITLSTGECWKDKDIREIEKVQYDHTCTDWVME